jgi:uncharacterized protein (TIGR03437 family)
VIGYGTIGYSQESAGNVAPASLSSMFDGGAEPFCDQTMIGTWSPAGSEAYELGGVSVTVGGHAAQLVFVSPSRLALVVPEEVTAGSAEVIVASQDDYLSRGVTNVSRSVFHLMTTTDGETGEAIAMNLTKQTDGFEVLTAGNLGPDKRTRLTLFAVGISGSAANSDTTNDITVGGVTVANFAESVVVKARLSSGVEINLPVEFAGRQTAMIGIDQVTVRLTPELKSAGVVTLKLMIVGQSSNAGTILIR